jgi:hypothetical protein
MNVLTVLGGARHMASTEVVREQGQLTITVAGSTGDQVGLFISSVPDQIYSVPWNGVLGVTNPVFAGGRLIRLGTIGGNGMLTRTLAYPSLGAGVQAQTRFLQVQVLVPGGTFVLGTPLDVVALDSAF